MTLCLSITGAIDRCEPGPHAAPVRILWIGTLAVRWDLDGQPRCFAAAVLRMETGGAGAIEGWGADRLALRWIGDPPAPEVAQSVYDWLTDRGPDRGELRAEIDSLPTSPGSASYRVRVSR